jgi:hypothetical protein
MRSGLFQEAYVTPYKGDFIFNLTILAPIKIEKNQTQQKTKTHRFITTLTYTIQKY